MWSRRSGMRARITRALRGLQCKSPTGRDNLRGAAARIRVPVGGAVLTAVVVGVAA